MSVSLPYCSKHVQGAASTTPGGVGVSGAPGDAVSYSSMNCSYWSRRLIPRSLNRVLQLAMTSAIIV